MEWIHSVKENARLRMQESMRMIEISLAQIDENEIWAKPNPVLNSMANLLLHLSGNIRQYIISSLGEQPDTRRRDLEFSQSRHATKKELILNLQHTITDALSVIDDSTEAQLLKKREVQGFEFDGLGIVIHVVEHLSYHTGQIAFWAKYKAGKDLGFYKGHNLNLLNP